MWTSFDVVWRPIVEFSMLAHSPSQKYRKRTSKLRCRRTRRRPVAHSFHSWMGKRDHRFLIPPLLKDEGKTVKSWGSDSLASKFFLNDSQNCSVRRKSHSGETFSIREQVVEEPWLWLPSVDNQQVSVSDSSSDIDDLRGTSKYSNGDMQNSKLLNQSRFSEDFSHKSDYDVNEKNSSEQRVAPPTIYLVEEPWIFESCIVPSRAEVISNVVRNQYDEDEVTGSAIDELHQPSFENPREAESTVMTKEDSVSSVILINSSICTVQRIAVLENDKLVELLLEPVKTNVQCGSVYLGVVTALAPQMNAAFINIGTRAFMGIRPYREPFIFDSPMKERDLHGSRSLFDKSGEQADFPENGAFSNGDEEPDEVEDDQSEDEFEGHENDFHSDGLDVIKANVNGGVVRHESVVDTQRSSEQLNGDVDHLENKSVPSIQVIGTGESKWVQVRKGSKIIVQVVKEGLGSKGPEVTAYPTLRSRFWILMTRCNKIGISKKIYGVERTRLRAIAKNLQPPGFGLTVRTVASGHSLEELQKDLEGLLSTWKSIVDHAKCATLAADEGFDGAVPVMLHSAMGQTLSVVQDYFNEKVKSMVVDSPRTYHEVTNYLQDIAPDLCDRVELYSKKTPLFDEYNIEDEINNMLSKRVSLANGGYLVIEPTEALVSIDVNGGQCMLGQGTSKEQATLKVNLAAATQIARELRLRDIGGIIVVDFIDMLDDANKWLVYEAVKKAVERDRSVVNVSELSKRGLMEITRKRVRPSVTFMISEPCTCCHGTGRVVSLETSFSKIEHEICRLLSTMDQKADSEKPTSWPRFILRVDKHMSNYLTSGQRTKLAVLSSAFKVWILLKVDRGLNRGAFELKLLNDDDEGTTIPKKVITGSPLGKFLPFKKLKSGGKSLK